MRSVRTFIAAWSVAVVGLLSSGAALAQSGHFLDRTLQCTDVGTQVSCVGKVAGLGGTTFQILVQAQGTATAECTNPGGNVAPGQTKTVTTLGDSGPLPTPRNGSFVFSLSTAVPSAPAGSCPNESWTATIVDVIFTSATIQVFEDGVLSDTATVSLQ